MKCLMRYRPQRTHVRGLSTSHPKQHCAAFSNPFWTVAVTIHTIRVRKDSTYRSFKNNTMAQCYLTPSERRK
jgi:hypothetical protein